MNVDEEGRVRLEPFRCLDPVRWYRQEPGAFRTEDRRRFEERG